LELVWRVCIVVADGSPSLATEFTDYTDNARKKKPFLELTAGKNARNIPNGGSKRKSVKPLGDHLGASCSFSVLP